MYHGVSRRFCLLVGLRLTVVGFFKLIVKAKTSKQTLMFMMLF